MWGTDNRMRFIWDFKESYRRLTPMFARLIRPNEK